MADDVSVKFGANIQGLIAGVEEVKSSIDSISDTARHVAEIFGVAFGVDAIKNFVERMADLGAQTERTAAILGLSNQKVIELSGYAELGNESIGDLAQQIQRAELNLQRSTRDGFNPAAQALRVLHLNAKDFIGLAPDQFVNKLADSLSRFNPSINLATAVTQAFGRGVAQMLPSLLQGRQHMEEFEAAWLKASEGLAASVPGMADTKEKLGLLEQSATSFGARLFSVLKPAIDGAIKWMTDWLQSMDSAKIKSFATSAVNYLETATINIATFFFGAETSVDEFIKKLNLALEKLGLIASTVAGGVAGGFLGSVIPGAGTAVGAAAGAAAGAITYELSNTGAAEPSEIVNRINASFAALQPTVADKVRAFFDGIKKAIQDGNAELGKTKPGLDVGAINMQAADQAKAAAEKYEAMVKAADAAYQSEAQHLDAEYKLHLITYDQETAALQAALAKRYAAEMAALSQEEALYARGSSQWQKVINQEFSAYQKFMSDKRKLTDKQAEQDAKDWEDVLKPIESSWNSQLRSVLSGTETFGQAMTKVFGDMVIMIIEKLEELIVRLVLVKGLMAIFGGGPSNIFGGIFSGLFGGGGGGGGVPSFDVGSWRIPSDTLAVVHRGEMIVPAQGGYADSMRAALSGSGGSSPALNVTFQVHALDGASVNQFFRANAKALANTLRQHFDNNPTMRPAY